MSIAVQQQLACLLVFGGPLVLALMLAVPHGLATIRAAQPTQPSRHLVAAVARHRRWR
ncbi:hypothetical protein [Methylobacterium aquaticum]|uniref:Uncharacterized protein n=1 Tax=Methylobacterium aquaticum TaxID=270351 RepID=A0A0C6FH16_9HYPH|nr:hypothetical protein [Methylobacterium aquaticum]BAQ44364.1 hypothetical protein Maq22A_c04790 [Methylobacterium aquaticum]